MYQSSYFGNDCKRSKKLLLKPGEIKFIINEISTAIQFELW
jgi:tmRNA-binding protein